MLELQVCTSTLGLKFHRSHKVHVLRWNIHHPKDLEGLDVEEKMFLRLLVFREGNITLVILEKHASYSPSFHFQSCLPSEGQWRIRPFHINSQIATRQGWGH